MTMAAAIEDRTADTSTWSKPGRIASIDIVHDLASAEAAWRSLENAQQSSTPYQRFDFLSAWQHLVGEREGLVPVNVIAYDAERTPLLLLPLALRHAYGARCAVSWAASTRPSTWRCGTGILPQARHKPISRI